MPTEMSYPLEQTQQGVRLEVPRQYGPSDAKRQPTPPSLVPKFRKTLFQTYGIHSLSIDSLTSRNIRVNSFTMKMKSLLESASNKLDDSIHTARNSCQERILLNLNQSDHYVDPHGSKARQTSKSSCEKLKYMFQDFRYSDTAHLSRSDEVLKLKNFKKDATLSFSKKGIMHVGPEVASPQDGKVSRWQRDYAWLMISRCSRSQCQIQVQGTSLIQKSIITTTYSQEKVKSTSLKTKIKNSI
ncbi:hypothetical protein Tco_0989263 [Tanacetum coccineum]|uniref:Uncharacterized protein n=1 Tax=Tanacetum coccineum TaxID=301880 RepID=A0ABQ5ETM1_9ASTR